MYKHEDLLCFVFYVSSKRHANIDKLKNLVIKRHYSLIDVTGRHLSNRKCGADGNLRL